MLMYDPAERISAKKSLQHRYFVSSLGLIIRRQIMWQKLTPRFEHLRPTARVSHPLELVAKQCISYMLNLLKADSYVQYQG